jgi:hypothetical protein
MMEKVIKKYGPEGHEFGVLRREDDRKVYETHRSRKSHFMRKYEAWGIERIVLNDIIFMGCDTVRIILKGEGVIEAKAIDFEKEGILDQYPPFGEQYFLPQSFFQWKKKEGVAPIF